MTSYDYDQDEENYPPKNKANELCNDIYDALEEHCDDDEGKMHIQNVQDCLTEDDLEGACQDLQRLIMFIEHNEDAFDDELKQQEIKAMAIDAQNLLLLAQKEKKAPQELDN